MLLTFPWRSQCENSMTCYHCPSNNSTGSPAWCGSVTCSKSDLNSFVSFSESNLRFCSQNLCSKSTKVIPEVGPYSCPLFKFCCQVRRHYWMLQFVACTQRRLCNVQNRGRNLFKVPFMLTFLQLFHQGRDCHWCLHDNPPGISLTSPHTHSWLTQQSRKADLGNFWASARILLCQGREVLSPQESDCHPAHIGSSFQNPAVSCLVTAIF